MLSSEEMMMLNWTVILKRLLRVPWTARSNQSILKEINPEYSLEGLMLKLKICLTSWCKELIHGKDPNAGKVRRQKKKETVEDEMVMVSPTQWAWIWANSMRNQRTEESGIYRLHRVGHNLVAEQQLRVDYTKEAFSLDI